MAQQKIADFFAEIGVKVSERSLKTLEKNLEKIVNKLEKAESAGRAMSGILKGTSKAADAENKSIQAGNKVLAERQKRYEAINKIAAKVQKNNNKVSRISAKTSMFATAAFDAYRRSGPARWQKASTGKGSVSGWNKNFKHALSSLTESSGAMSIRARAAQQSMYDSLFGAVDTSAADKQRAIMDRLHGQALREDARRTRAAQNLARIQENVAKREQAMAERTAAIREAGAKRAAAIIQAAELKAQAMAARATGSGAGGSRRGSSVMGGATVGGAIGSASSNIAGFLPGFGVAWSMMNLNRINQELQANKLAMTAVMGNEQAGGEQSAWLKNLANTVGFDYRQTMPAYTKMLASGQSAGLSTGSVQNIFKGVSEYGRVMGLDTESMKGSMRALEQMMNKGQVMSEELKGQLAERMPGVISAMTEAGGFKDPADLFKAMENGQVKSAKVLEKFAAILAERARQGGALEKAMESSAAEQARFNNSFSEFVVLMGNSGMDAGFANIFKTLSRFFRENPDLAKGMAEAINKLAKALDWLRNTLTNLSLAFSDFAKLLGMSGAELALLITGVAFLSTGFGMLVGVITAVALVIEDLYVSLNGGDGLFRRFYDSLSPENQEKIKGVGESLGKLRDAFNELFSAFSKLDMKPLAPLFESAFGGVAEIVQGHIDRLTTLVRLMAKITAGDWSGAAEVAVNDVKNRAISTGKSVLSILPDDFMGGDQSTGMYSSGMTYGQMMSKNKYNKDVSDATNNTTFGDINIKVELSGVDPVTMNQQLGKNIADEFISAIKNFTGNE